MLALRLRPSTGLRWREEPHGRTALRKAKARAVRRLQLPGGVVNTGLVQQVTIVVVGTAGWLIAAFLNAKLNTAESGRRVEVVLIESPTVPIIGVGEGTLPSMVAVLREIGIDERDFFKQCNASFKFGVRFEGWNLNEHGIPYSFIHPFGAFARDVNGIMPIYRVSGLRSPRQASRLRFEKSVCRLNLFVPQIELSGTNVPGSRSYMAFL